MRCVRWHRCSRGSQQQESFIAKSRSARWLRLRRQLRRRAEVVSAAGAVVEVWSMPAPVADKERTRRPPADPETERQRQTGPCPSPPSPLPPRPPPSPPPTVAAAAAAGRNFRIGPERRRRRGLRAVRSIDWLRHTRRWTELTGLAQVSRPAAGRINRAAGQRARGEPARGVPRCRRPRVGRRPATDGCERRRSVTELDDWGASGVARSAGYLSRVVPRYCTALGCRAPPFAGLPQVRHKQNERVASREHQIVLLRAGRARRRPGRRGAAEPGTRAARIGRIGYCVFMYSFPRLAVDSFVSLPLRQRYDALLQ